MNPSLSREACYGALVIDHDARTHDFHGMDGNGSDMEAREVLDIVEKALAAGKVAWCLIFWHDENQLAVHDPAGFVQEIEKLEDWHLCRNCSKMWKEDELKPILDLAQRAEIDDDPSGECPECHALCDLMGEDDDE